MRRLFSYAVVCMALSSVFSCSKTTESIQKTTDVSPDALAKINALGFSTDQVIKRDGGYLVEGDILLSEAELNAAPPSSPMLRIAQSEQYRTNNLVSGTRVITVSVTNLPTVYSNATNAAIVRYNAQGLRITFQRVSSGGNIDVIGFNEGVDSQGYITLGSSGFPTSSGNPYNQIKMNVNPAAYGTNPNVNYLTSVLTHEIGHCIGFRHTDYYNRSYSCGGRRYNEGSAGIGAVLIPGTPKTAQPDSWMLACSNGSDRQFNSYDVTALQYLY